MAESYLGKWKVDLDSTTGLEEFGAAIGFSDEKIELYRKLVYVVDLSSDGETFTVDISFEGALVPAQHYNFKLGDTFDYNAIDGTKPKLTISVDNGKLIETYRLEEKDKEWITVREVQGDVLISTTTYAGKSVVQKLHRI